MIEYLYCNEIELDKEIAVGLLELSEEYSLPILQKKCARYLTTIMNKENFVELANLVDKVQVEPLNKSLVNYFISFKASLLEAIDVQGLPKSFLEQCIREL